MLKGYSSSTKLVIKLVIEFYAARPVLPGNHRIRFLVSTAVFMVATGVSLVVMWYLFQQFALMAMITAATGLLAGAVTFGMHDPKYMQMKPTIVSLTFALILLTGLMLRQTAVQMVAWPKPSPDRRRLARIDLDMVCIFSVCRGTERVYLANQQL